MTGWTIGEQNVLATAAAAAPSVHNTRPWVLELAGEEHVAELYELPGRVLPRHDPLGRDRRISCGAALEHVLIGMRVLGWTAAVDLFPEPGRPDLLARVTATGRTEPADVDLAAHGAMARRRSHRKPFGSAPVAPATRAAVLAANRVDGVGLRPVSDVDAAALAKVLCHSALVLRADRAYQRELSAWTSPVREPLPGGGVSAATRRPATMPWAGLVRASTAVPDTDTLAHRLRDEFLLLVVTPDDGPADHVRAGMTAASVWLAAVAAGLAGSLVTQPFQLHESRAGLVESLCLSGFPQLLLRFGSPNQHREEK